MDPVTYERRGAAAVLTINREERRKQQRKAVELRKRVGW